ncbi:MAG: FAD:protein FMN transferase [Dehalococcoidia bacterium]|nr:MAG: FAD:protein FMN transferase [Dehalococcoidia bacterium]
MADAHAGLAVSREFAGMGGTIEVQLVNRGAADADGIEALFASYERTMSRFLPDSELCALNGAAGAPFEASPVLFDAVRLALEWARATDGTFDPTLLDELEAAGYDRSFEQLAGGVPPRPSPPARHAARWRAIALDETRRAITVPAGVHIDLGGIGKGFTVDRAIASLGDGANAMVNASGDLFAAGDGPEGDGWYVGVANPFEMGHDVAVLRVRDRGVATSGSARRHWTAGDRRYHHLIDPRAGVSSDSDLLTVTVVAATATDADVLAKTAYLLGSRDGVRFVEQRDSCACMAVTLRGDVVRSRGIDAYETH